MARSFRRLRQTRAIAELNVTNLIDLGFTLLIIFMIATPLINQEQTIPIRLPSESKSRQERPDSSDRFVAVSIDAAGRYYIGTTPRPIALSDLRSRLRMYGEEEKPPIIRVRGDANVPYEKIIQLLDELKKANLTRTTFDTQPQD
jgi:biopolymer transport protein ExbD